MEMKIIPRMSDKGINRWIKKEENNKKRRWDFENFFYK